MKGFIKVMTLRPLVLQANIPCFSPTFTCYLKPSFQSKAMPQMLLQSKFGRRSGMIAVMTSALLAGEAVFRKECASGFDFGMVAPDQTVEEAEIGIRSHAQSLIQVKDLIESESWGDAQRELRKSSALLKQDIYTIIQGKPANDRPLLRKLYSDLFNNVTRLDYAARDKDASRVRQCYENIVVALNDILSRV